MAKSAIRPQLSGDADAVLTGYSHVDHNEVRQRRTHRRSVELGEQRLAVADMDEIQRRRSFSSRQPN